MKTILNLAQEAGMLWISAPDCINFSKIAMLLFWGGSGWIMCLLAILLLKPKRS